MVTLSVDNFNNEVLKSSTPVLVDFWATWCGPCRMVSPIVDELAEEYTGKLKVGKVNVDEQNKIAGEYGIMSIPTVIIFKNGKAVDKIIGARSKQQFKSFIDKNL